MSVHLRQLVACLAVALTATAGCSAVVSGSPAPVGAAIVSPTIPRPFPTAGSATPPQSADGSTGSSAESSSAGSASADSAPETEPSRPTGDPESTGPVVTPTVLNPSTVPNPATSAPASTAGSPTVVGPCPGVNSADVDAVIACLRVAADGFWSGQLNQPITEPVVADPSITDVPEKCRPALTTTPAFTCLVDGTLYITKPFADQIRRTFTGQDLIYAYAALIGHEIGHVVQRAVHQPNVGSATTDAQSRQIEQQADCLAGVWAAALVKAGRLDGRRFVDDGYTLISAISSNPEIAAHGDPPTRRQAMQRGLAGGRPQACQLATFS